MITISAALCSAHSCDSIPEHQPCAVNLLDVLTQHPPPPPCSVGQTLLMVASKYGRKRCIAELIDVFGADVNQAGGIGRYTALHYAAFHGHVAAVRYAPGPLPPCPPAGQQRLAMRCLHTLIDSWRSHTGNRVLLQRVSSVHFLENEFTGRLSNGRPKPNRLSWSDFFKMISDHLALIKASCITRCAPQNPAGARRTDRCAHGRGRVSPPGGDGQRQCGYRLHDFGVLGRGG
jgi:hypothetical protein